MARANQPYKNYYIEKERNGKWFSARSEKPSKRPKNGDSCHVPYLRFRRKTPCPEGETPVGHFAGFGEGVTRRQQQPGQAYGLSRLLEII